VPAAANADGKPRHLWCPRPEYPPAAVRAMAQGRTVIELDVDDAGHVVTGDIAGSSGPARERRVVDNAALASMRGCVFDAGPRCGRGQHPADLHLGAERGAGAAQVRRVGVVAPASPPFSRGRASGAAYPRRNHRR